MPTVPPCPVNSDEILTTAPCRADLAGGTLDIWPLYLFHPGAVSVNVALNILTSCKITPRSGREIVLRSHDTGRHERFADLDELLAAKTYQHPLAAYLVRFFKPDAGFTLETHSESPGGRGHLRFLGADDRHHRGAGAFCGAQD